MSSSRSRYWFSPRSSAIFSMFSFSVSSEAECSSSVFMFSTTVFSVCFSFSTRSIVLFALNSSATLVAFSSFSWSTLRIAFFSRSFSPSDSLLQVVRSRSKMFRSPRQSRHTRTALVKPYFGSGLDRFEHTPQNTPPQLRQWCLLRNGVKADAQAMHRGASQSGIHLGGSSGIRRCCSCASFLDPLALCLRVPPPPPADAFPPSTTMHASLRLTLRSCAVRLPPTIPPPPAPPAPTGEEATTDTDTFTVTFRLSTLAVRRTGDESPDEPNTESCSGFASSAE
uniref:Uncharacterized protein n=1 Tax=Anopheles coluzzii TaxID=1518534 RepID=A0A8W7PB82_ANOCL